MAAALLAALKSALGSVDIVLLSDYAKGVLGDEVLQRAIAMIHNAGKRLVVDPKSRDFRRYAGADLLTPNRGELAAATGMTGEDDESVAAAAQKAIAAAGVSAQNQHYGMNTRVLTPQMADKTAELGAGVVRLPYGWDLIEPNCKRCFNWTTTDAWRDEAHRTRRIIFGSLAYAPSSA